MTAYLGLACEAERVSPIEAPMQQALRGSWQAPEAEGLTRCAVCATHADEFAQTSERDGDRGMPGYETAGLLAVVYREHQMTARPFAEVLRDELVARVQSSAADVLPTVLLRYADQVIEQHGLDTLVDAVGEEEWREAVGYVLEDLDDAAPTARVPLASTQLYTQLRAVVAEALRQRPSVPA